MLHPLIFFTFRLLSYIRLYSLYQTSPRHSCLLTPFAFLLCPLFSLLTGFSSPITLTMSFHLIRPSLCLSLSLFLLFLFFFSFFFFWLSPFLSPFLSNTLFPSYYSYYAISSNTHFSWPVSSLFSLFSFFPSFPSFAFSFLLFYPLLSSLTSFSLPVTPTMSFHLIRSSLCLFPSIPFLLVSFQPLQLLVMVSCLFQSLSMCP